MAIVPIVCIFFICFLAYKLWGMRSLGNKTSSIARSGGEYTLTEDSFSQNGVTVNFANKTIFIRGKDYKIDDVCALQWSDAGGFFVRSSFVTIEVDDIDKPLHRIRFSTWNLGKGFMSRLAVAIKKAGGPNFS